VRDGPEGIGLKKDLFQKLKIKIKMENDDVIDELVIESSYVSTEIMMSLDQLCCIYDPTLGCLPT
jgi:hypothetical protein